MPDKKEGPVIDKAGRIVLPSGARELVGWDDGSPVEIWLDGARGEIILRQHRPSCALCGGEAGLSPFLNKQLCAVCRYKISQDG